jgi:hypothetical protein
MADEKTEECPVSATKNSNHASLLSIFAVEFFFMNRRCHFQTQYQKLCLIISSPQNEQRTEQKGVGTANDVGK